MTVTSVNFTLSGDNEVQAWLNGNYLGDFVGPMVGDSHLYTRCAPVTVNPAWFRAGTNVLTFRLINTMTFHGLTYECCLGFTCAGAPLTATPTFTYTLTATPTPTGTWMTSMPTKTPKRVCHPVPYPNPSHGEKMNFNCGGGPYDEIHVKVYTTGFRKICEKKPLCHELEEEDVDWDLKDDYGAPVANGLYFVEIETHQKGTVKKYVEKCLIL